MNSLSVLLAGKSLSRFLNGKNFRTRKGVTALEYGLIAALIAVVIIIALTLTGIKLNTIYETIDANFQVIGVDLNTYAAPSFTEASFSNSSVEVWYGPTIGNSQVETVVTNANTSSQQFSGLTGVQAIPGVDGNFSDGAAIPNSATVSGDAHSWSVSNLPTSMVKTSLDQTCANMGGTTSQTQTGVSCTDLGYSIPYNQNTFLGAYGIKP